jgi:hypothetical protein
MVPAHKTTCVWYHTEPHYLMNTATKDQEYNCIPVNKTIILVSSIELQASQDNEIRLG